MMKKYLLSFLLAMMTTVVPAQEVINLWPNGAPNKNGDAQDVAQLTAFLPDAKRATGRAIVVCPGGAYKFLAMDHEGTHWATYLNKQGIALFVLKYRLPHGKPEVPVSDAEEAIKLVRRNAAKWHIDTRQVGIMGFSAGGHLASTIATHSKGDAKPDFQILFYPVITMDPGYTHKESMENFLGSKPSKSQMAKYSNDLQVSQTTPRAFIALSDDDKSVLPANGANYYMECYRHDIPASLHIYPSGGHGWGYRETFDFHYEVLAELKAWLASF